MSPGPAVADDSASTAAEAYLAVMDTVPGWFYPADARIFLAIDSLQKARGITGHLMEIGAYLGKSAILLGYLVAESERLVVCDLFADTADVSGENVAESRTHYPGLQREEFERHYLRFHSALPEILAIPSTQIDPRPLAGTFRLVHVDGSHTYEVVRQDIATARQLLGPGGIVVFDDWMQAHAPGVALAMWEEFLRGELIPVCFTHLKFYATLDPSGLTPADLDAWASAQPELQMSYPHRLAGREVRRYTMSAEREAAASRAPVTSAAKKGSAVHERAPVEPARGSLARRLLRQSLPPAALAAYRRIRRRRATSR